MSCRTSFLASVVGLVTVMVATLSRAAEMTAGQWHDAANAALLDYYEKKPAIVPDVSPVVAGWDGAARRVATSDEGALEPLPYKIGVRRARLEQATVLEMARAIRAGDIARAQALRVELSLPRGVSSNDGAMVLQALGAKNKDDAVRVLAREAVTWQTTRARVLLDEAAQSAKEPIAMPGRLLERLAEAVTLADLPGELASACDVKSAGNAGVSGADLMALSKHTWDAALAADVDKLGQAVESKLPVLLSDKERERRERLLLKLVQLVPREYGSGVRDGQVTVPLEYREAVTFTRQARQIFGELAPLWLANAEKHDSVAKLQATLDKADATIASKAMQADVDGVMKSASDILQGDFGITLRRSGTTADIVDEVMLEVRSLLSQSLSQALAGNWAEAERLRLEAYTTFDPDLEARLMPRDPQLGMNIEHLLLDGLNKPGVKVLLDQKVTGPELQEAYAAVNASLDQAAALLKAGVSPWAAGVNSLSIVLREGIEGLLVVVAIFAGLRGDGAARKRRLVWVGIAASMVATGITWVLSRTLITSLHAYGEIIEAVTGILAVGILLLITNWLFQQVYWRQWVTSLKAQAGEDSTTWSLITVGFLVGYREGFETVLFLQSLMMDSGAVPVGLGVLVGCVTLVALGYAALKLGMKLPYYQILLVTALMIGVVLVSFVGTTARAMETVGWLPVHRLMPFSWPAWMGSWLGLYNTWESVGMQVLMVTVVIGTWRWARFKAKRKPRRAPVSLKQVAPEPAGAGVCSLAALGVGCTGRVMDISGDDELRRRLLEMGLCGGTTIECIRKAPLGDPIEYRVRGYHLSLRGEQASQVSVSVESAVRETVAVETP